MRNVPSPLSYFLKYESNMFSRKGCGDQSVRQGVGTWNATTTPSTPLGTPMLSLYTVEPKLPPLTGLLALLVLGCFAMLINCPTVIGTAYKTSLAVQVHRSQSNPVARLRTRFQFHDTIKHLLWDTAFQTVISGRRFWSVTTIGEFHHLWFLLHYLWVVCSNAVIKFLKWCENRWNINN